MQSSQDSHHYFNKMCAQKRMTANVKKENNFHLLYSSWFDKISIIIMLCVKWMEQASKQTNRQSGGRAGMQASKRVRKQASDSMNTELMKSPDDGKRGRAVLCGIIAAVES